MLTRRSFLLGTAGTILASGVGLAAATKNRAKTATVTLAVKGMT